jgi:hypothetical protein
MHCAAAAAAAAVQDLGVLVDGEGLPHIQAWRNVLRGPVAQGRKATTASLSGVGLLLSVQAVGGRVKGLRSVVQVDTGVSHKERGTITREAACHAALGMC